MIDIYFWSSIVVLWVFVVAHIYPALPKSEVFACSEVKSGEQLAPPEVVRMCKRHGAWK